MDWVIVIAYLLAMAAVGVYFSRRQTSLDQYLLAVVATTVGRGDKPVGLSIRTGRLTTGSGSLGTLIKC